MPTAPTFRQRLRRVIAPIPGAVPLVRVTAETAMVAFRYRATGLAAEAAFFTLLSLPPLLLTLVAGAGFASEWLGPATLDRMSSALERWSSTFLTPETVEQVIMPTFQETLTAGRADILSVGFLVALWSGSRALHIFLDAISIMYGQGGERGPVAARILSLTAYLGAVVMMGMTLPLLLIGPGYLVRWLPTELEMLVELYWPLVGLLGFVSLTGLFHVSTPQRSPFWRDLPGALLTVIFWVVSSVLIRRWAELASGGVSVFGPLSAPIILMVYLYFLSFAVLVGASLNAAIRRLWPPPEYRGPKARVNEWWEERQASRAARQEEQERLAAARTDEEEERELAGMDGIPGPR
ncbi:MULTISPECIES: YihY/virulence factor BrkB family protein [unclassified Serinicoccus]|uniref:YihY/virulence factor BrkB family protein n=1 Tax=unclassified Serinicoccus TaxID=2643101 RepID=UPI0038540BED